MGYLDPLVTASASYKSRLDTTWNFEAPSLFHHHHGCLILSNIQHIEHTTRDIIVSKKFFSFGIVVVLLMVSCVASKCGDL
jgi:hypothetical protein